MHMFASVIIFLMGGAAAVIILRLLLFHFCDKSLRKTEDEQYLKRIADVLQ